MIIIIYSVLSGFCFGLVAGGYIGAISGPPQPMSSTTLLVIGVWTITVAVLSGKRQ